MTSCRHCREEIVPCTEAIRFCKGWKHARFLHYGPVGAHYCEGRSINPVAEPVTAESVNAEIREGLAAAQRGETYDLGGFAQYGGKECGPSLVAEILPLALALVPSVPIVSRAWMRLVLN